MRIKTILLTVICCVYYISSAQDARYESLFDDGWKFYKGNVAGAEATSFDDASWRSIDLPHDWSIETLPDQKQGEVVGPFSKTSIGTTATGYTVGGTAWYRKTFTLKAGETYTQSVINFDGVYMNCEVYVNGKLLANHPYGYTPFDVDITSALNQAGQPNVIAVKVINEGKNSRWYSGSGIYRHVWLIRKQPVHIAQNGVWASTESLSADKAKIKISAIVEGDFSKATPIQLLIKLIGPDGKTTETVSIPASKVNPGKQIDQYIPVKNPKAWSVEKPNLYSAQVEVIINGKLTDRTKIVFGIRTIHFDAATGFTLNGKRVLLKGGCLHNDNGFLGSATIDRAEERRVELMKAYGYNAIRTSHNAPSKQFLAACDRNGVLVINEAFDMWERPKNPQDYHLYFKDWWQKDLKALIHRDRNHPSVIFWSIGNEINERVDSLGLRLKKSSWQKLSVWIAHVL